MSFCIAKPSPVLAHLVKHYWTLGHCLPNGESHIQRIVPNGLMELVFYFEEVPQVLQNSFSIEARTVVGGQLNQFYDLKIPRRLSLFSIVFKPQGLALLLDLPVHVLYNQQVPLKYLLKDSVPELENRLYEASGFQERVMVAESFLIRQIGKRKEKYQFSRITHCLGIISQSKGMAGINHLASEACYSRKQFERVFSEYVGTSPLRFLRAVRFQYAIHAKATNPKMNLTELAHHCGYYDQAHMVNDFVKLSGLTPKQYFNQCEPFSDYFG